MVSTIDGSEITEVTVDGDDIQEITMDGDIVWTAEELIDSFEHNDLSSFYSNPVGEDGLSDWVTSSHSAIDGTYALRKRHVGGDADAIYSSPDEHDLPHYPEPGVYMKFAYYLAHNHQDHLRLFFGWDGFDVGGIAGQDQHHYRFYISFNSPDFQLQLRKLDNDAGTFLDTDSVPNRSAWDEGRWYEAHVDWRFTDADTIVGKFFDENGDEAMRVEAVDTDFNDPAFGWRSGPGAGDFNDARADFLHMSSNTDTFLT